MSTSDNNIHAKNVITKAKYEDYKVQGMGAGLDEKVQAGTKPIFILKTDSEDTKNYNIHTQNVITKAKYEDAKNGNIYAKPKEL